MFVLLAASLLITVTIAAKIGVALPAVLDGSASLLSQAEKVKLKTQYKTKFINIKLF